MKLDFEKTNGLIPAIAQDFATGEVLMLAYINEEAWQETLSTGRAFYFSRSRKKLWRKGEESGNVQHVGLGAGGLHIEFVADMYGLAVHGGDTDAHAGGHHKCVAFHNCFLLFRSFI